MTDEQDAESVEAICYANGSTLSTAGAVPLPRWGRQRMRREALSKKVGEAATTSLKAEMSGQGLGLCTE